jgi:hypothetical protein
MDKNFNSVAKELFGKIRTQFPKIQLGDANSKVTDRPEDARFFEFDFVVDGKNIGTVSASISEDDGLVVMCGNDLVGEEPESIKRKWFNFLRELREFAKQNMMNFDVRDIAKSNLDKRDYQMLANNSGEVAMAESKLWGTSKTSFQEMGEAKLIVKHSKPVNYDLPAGRTMHIESIFIENAQGERFKYPFKHLNGARALATHVAHGGTSYDNIGQHIIGLSEELNKLRMFKGYVDRNPVVSEAMGAINSKVYERIDQVKKEIHSLQSPNYYKTFAESFTDAEDQMIPEDLVNDWVDRLTIRSFNEELKNVFPYIYKLVGENVAPVKELSPEDLLNTESMDIQDSVNNEIEELTNFESYLNKLVSEESDLFNDDESQSIAIQKLNQLVTQEFPVGADGTNAIQSLKGIIDDQEFTNALQELGKVSPEMDIRNVLQSYLEKKDEENGTDIASKINFGSAAPAPAPTPAAAPAEQPAPVAESNLVKAVRKAVTSGMQLEDTFNIGEKTFTLKDAIERAGLSVNEFFTEEVSSEHQDVVEFVKSMYDETTGSFPKGETGVLISVQKEFGDTAAEVAKNVIGELSAVYESQRIKKLAGLA